MSRYEMETGGETLTGSVHGKTITLDEEAPEFEGRRVRVRIEPIEDAEVELTAEENARLWAEWREREASGGSEPVQGAGVAWE